VTSSPTLPARAASTGVLVLAWGIVLVALVFIAFGVVGTLFIGEPSGSSSGGRWDVVQVDLFTAVLDVVGSIAAIAMVVSGAILVSRLPRNAVGWFLLVGGLCLTLAFGASALANVLVLAGLPGAVWSELLSSTAWIPMLVLIGIFVPLYFPSGQLPSPRWRVLVVAVLLAMTFSMLSSALVPFTPGELPVDFENPFAVTGAVADLVNFLGALGTVTGIICFPLVAIGFVHRFRRSRGIERAQLKWFAAAVGVIGVALPIGIASGSWTGSVAVVVGNIAYLCLFSGFILLPIAIGIAILRYQLFEIDRLISRTIVYALLIGALGAIYLGTILLLQALLASLSRSNELAVATSTLVVAALFQPVRARLKRATDRRFNRVRYDAEAELTLFVERLRDEVDLSQVSGDVALTIDRIMQPTAVRVWLRNSEPNRA
jgi:hypothetical protein